MPAYLPTDKQVNENPDESYKENLSFFYYLKVLNMFAGCLQVPSWEVLHTKACLCD